MTGLRQLHAFCTKLEHYPSRWAMQVEIERLLEEEAKQEEEAAAVVKDQGTDKVEAPAINGLGITVCPECGTPIKRCEKCPPYPAPIAKEQGGDGFLGTIMFNTAEERIVGMQKIANFLDSAKEQGEAGCGLSILGRIAAYMEPNKELWAKKLVGIDETLTKYRPAPVASVHKTDLSTPRVQDEKINTAPVASQGLVEAAIEAADVLNSLMPSNPRSKKREWIWQVHDRLTKAISRHSAKPTNQDDKGGR